MRDSSATLPLIFGAILAMGLSGATCTYAAAQIIEVRVDSVLASDTDGGIDPRLTQLANKLQGLFSYRSYTLERHEDQTTECGKTVEFTLPGGRILHIQPRATDGNMIAMEVVLFDGGRPMMTTDLKLRNNGTLMVGGPRYAEGMLIIAIGAYSGDARAMRHSAPPNANAQALP